MIGRVRAINLLENIAERQSRLPKLGREIKYEKKKKEKGRASKSSLLEKVIVDREGREKKEKREKGNGKSVDKQVSETKRENNNKTERRKKGTMKISKQTCSNCEKNESKQRGERERKKSYAVFSRAII